MSDFKSSFNLFVKNKSDSKQIDWELRKSNWLKQVENLYNQIDVWLAEWVKMGDISITKESLLITEEFLGSYQAPKLKIQIGNDSIAVIPVGTLIIGGRGRVDVRGPAGTAMMVLNEKDLTPGVEINVFTTDEELKAYNEQKKSRGSAELDWEKMIWNYAKRTPKLEFYELNEKLFQEILMSVAGA